MVLDIYLKKIQEKVESEDNYNINEYFDRLRKAVKKSSNIDVTILGYARDFPVLFIHPKILNEKARVLIGAGLHGDEASGPWSILNFLENYPYPTSVNVSFLPLINPTGFNLSRRADFWGEYPNRGFSKGDKSELPTHEDDILEKNITILSRFGKDCSLTLHEDDDEHFYIFTYGETDPLDKKILEMGKEKFGLVASKRLRLGGFKSKEDGIRYNDKDGSFEHGMFLKKVKKSITTENPGRRPFKERVEFYIEVIKEACKSKYY